MGVSQPKMIVVNYDKGFAEMSQHPAFRNRRTRRLPWMWTLAFCTTKAARARRRTATGRRARLRWRRSPRAGDGDSAALPLAKPLARLIAPRAIRDGGEARDAPCGLPYGHGADTAKRGGLGQVPSMPVLRITP